MFLRVQFATLVLLIGSTSPIALAQEKPAEPKPIARESLRYDGKPFEHWQTYWQTELKAERRVDCLRALGAFGSNGYGPEAAAAIVGVVRTYPERGFVASIQSDPDRLWPDEKVCFEAAKSLEKIGSPSVHALLAKADHPNVRFLAVELLADLCRLALPGDAIPAVVQLAFSKDPAQRDCALRIIHSQAYDDDKIAASLGKHLTTKSLQEKFFSVVLDNVRYESFAHFDTSEKLLVKVSPHVPKLKSLLIKKLRDLKDARQRDVEKEKKEYHEMPAPRQRYIYGGTWEAVLPVFYSESRSASVLVVNVLGKIGPDARDALPELRDAMQDPYVRLQTAAKNAMEQITKKQP